MLCKRFLGLPENNLEAFSQILRDLFYFPTPKAFTVFNRPVKVLVIDMLAILQTLILGMRTAGNLLLKTKQKFDGRTFFLLIIK